MAGLLDNFFGNSFEDPKSQAVMALAGGLLSNDWRKGLINYTQTMAGANEDKLKRAMQQAQMDERLQNIAESKHKMQMAIDAQKRKDDFYGNPSRDSLPTQNTPQGIVGAMSTPQGAMMGDGSAIPQQTDRLTQWANQYGIPRDAMAIDLVENNGKGIADMLMKRGTPNMQAHNGYFVDMNKVTNGVMPSIATTPDGKTTQISRGADGQPIVSIPQGALESVARYGQQAAKLAAGQQLVDMVDENGRPGKMFLSDIQNQNRQAQQNSPTLTPRPLQGKNIQSPAYNGGSRDAANAESIRMIQSEMNNPNTPPQYKAGLAREIQRMQAQSGALQQAPSSFPMGGQSSGMAIATGLSPQQKAAAEAGGKINETWLNKVYAPMLEKIPANNDLLTSIDVTRNAIDKMGGTGWSTEAKANAANILAGLGIGDKNAKMYATNAQVFQNQAMSRLNAELRLNTGVQTEGDAQRTAKAYAQLSNTTDANKFILDLAQAKAQREKMKADFYQNALPHATKGGDLQVIDRKWMEKMPSIYNMPSMQKWSK